MDVDDFADAHSISITKTFNTTHSEHRYNHCFGCTCEQTGYHHLFNLISIEVFESPLVDLEAFTQIGDVSLHPADVDAVILVPNRLLG